MTVSESTNQSRGGRQQEKSRRKTRGPRSSGGISRGKAEARALVGAMEDSSVASPESEVVWVRDRAAAKSTARAAAREASVVAGVVAAREAAREAASAAARRTAKRRARAAEAATERDLRFFCFCF